MEIDQSHEENLHKKGRHRKKQLYKAILQQMEFYFSDANLQKDRFLGELIKQDPYVDLAIFLKFNKIRKLTLSLENIVKAVAKSTLIELSEDRTKVKRSTPIKVKDNIDECTIYVERLKSDATHEWLTSIFSEFGNVVYVSIPKYKHNGMIKGFAFVEFENEASAKAALQHFESIDCKIPLNIEPEKLCSIATFEGDESNKRTNENVETDANVTKKKRRDSSDEESVRKQKDKIENETKLEDTKENSKRKHSIDEEPSKRFKSNKENKCEDEAAKEDVQVHFKSTADEESLVQTQNKELVTEENSQVLISEKETTKKKKHKKSHKKKAILKDIGLQILSKKEWKKMRNKYLEMQRKTMQQLKAHFNRQRFATPSYENTRKIINTKVEVKPTLQYIPGTIVKILLAEPCHEGKKFKTEIQSLCSDVKFIDIPHPGSEEIFVRFSANQTAQDFCASCNKGKAQLLEGAEESQYWEKIEMAKKAKTKKNDKQRGRDKLLKKAQAAKHIRFEDGDG